MAKVVFNSKTKKKSISINKNVKSSSKNDEETLIDRTTINFKNKNTTKEQLDSIVQPIAKKSILSDIEIKPKVEFKPKIQKKQKTSYKSLPKESKEKNIYIDKIVEKVVEKEVFVEKVVEKEVFVDKIIEKPIYIETPIKKLEQIDTPEKVEESPIKEIVVITDCPFKDGDLIKYKDEIYLVTKFDDRYYIRTSSNGFRKKRIPNDWGIFNKI